MRRDSNVVTTAGTQQELRKLSVSESHNTPKSIQEILDQLQDTVELLGADKRQVCKWVANAFGLVRHSSHLAFSRTSSHPSWMKEKQAWLSESFRLVDVHPLDNQTASCWFQI